MAVSGSDMYKYVAYVDLVDGKQVHLVLPQIELFNQKLE